MNKTHYRLVFNKLRGMLMAVAEHVASSGKSNRETSSQNSESVTTSQNLFEIDRFKQKLLVMAVFSVFATGANAASGEVLVDDGVGGYTPTQGVYTPAAGTLDVGNDTLGGVAGTINVNNGLPQPGSTTIQLRGDIGQIGTNTISTTGLATLDSATVNTTLTTTGDLTLGTASNTNTIGQAGTSANTLTGVTNTIAGSTSSTISGGTNSVAVDGITGVAANGNGAALTLNGGNASVLNSTNHGLNVGPNSTTISGGTNSAVWTLQDGNLDSGNPALGTAPGGATLTVSGRTGTAKPLFNATTNDDSTLPLPGMSGSAVTIGLAADTVTNINGLTNNITATGVGATNNIAGTTNINTTTPVGTLTTIGNAANAVTNQALQVNGGISSTGNAAIATANGTTNTFGSGTGANNAIGGGSNSVNTVGNAGSSTNLMQGSTNTITGTTSTVLTGGTTTMTLNNSGASFANNATGAPVRVGGVADGVAPTDAVNKRQFDMLDNKLGNVADKAYAGVASALAMSALPQIRPGFNYNIGMAVGNYANQSAIAIGAKANIGENWQVTASAGVSDGNNAVAVGGGFNW
ncbi:MAG: hypothetical protein B7X73_04875 [Methylophilales bacterium 39-45-7]|nr:MAG: hypothetical protein B7X73_04875 [Methylophilales bacterium 39-45-7]